MKYVSIFDDHVRLYADGTIKHCEPELGGVYREGWGPWGTRSLLGQDGRKYEAWRIRIRDRKTSKGKGVRHG